LDCGGKRSATPLFAPTSLIRCNPAKALSPLRSASAVQKSPPPIIIDFRGESILKTRPKTFPVR